MVGNKHSGRQSGFGKLKVGACVCLSVREVVWMIRKDRAWRIEVCANGRKLGLVTFIEPDGNDPVAYAGLLEDAKPERWQALPLEHLATAFGGLRWWLNCPLSPGGKKCGRRVGKLYLPDIDSGFGCRACHQLAY